MLRDLFPKKPRDLSDDEKIELNKTLQYSNGKLFETFNFAKSMWNIAFDNIDISLKKNKTYLNLGMGYIFFFKKEENKIYVWEYQIKKDRKNPNTNRTTIKLIYENLLEEVTLTSIVEGYSSFCKLKNCKSLPVFEMQCNQEFPMEQTLVPIMKRKVMSHIFQTLNLSKIKNFDSE